MNSVVSLILVLSAIGVMLCIVTVIVLARALLRPPRMTDGKAMYLLRRLSPGDLGMRFEETAFEVEDRAEGGRIRLAGWWIPHPASSQKTVVLIHGYSDAKVGAIAWAPMFQSLGYHLLAIDLRAHGESGGAYSTGGYFERYDLDQVIGRIRADRPRETEALALFGVSLGGVVAAATSGLRGDIDAIIMESPYADFRHAIAARGRSMGVATSLTKLAIRLAERLSGADFDAVKPTDLIRNVPCPLMILHSGDDLFVDESDIRTIEAAAGKRAALTERHVIPDVIHVMGLAAEPREYANRIRMFLDRACGISATTTLIPSNAMERT